MRIENLQNENRKYAKSIKNFHVLEYVQDASVSPMNAMNEYFMSKMNVRRRQVVIDIDKDHSAVIQAGAMQWMGGNVQATSGVKGIGDFLGKALKGAVTKETAVKPEYVGEGCLVLEPTYKYIILADIGKWGPAGMTIEDGMFLACDANVKSKVVARKNLSSAVLGSEGLFNLSLQGNGVAALESNVPEDELIRIYTELITVSVYHQYVFYSLFKMYPIIAPIAPPNTCVNCEILSLNIIPSFHPQNIQCNNHLHVY